MKRGTGWVLVMVFCVQLVLLVGCKQPSGTEENTPLIATNLPETIKIGFLGNLSNGATDYGTHTLRGIQLAAEEINQSGGILGQAIEIIVEDTSSDFAQVANASQKLVIQDKVAAIIGDPSTREMRVVAPIAQNSHIVLLSAGDVDPAVVEIGDYIFQTTFLDALLISSVVEYLAQDIGWKKTGIVTVESNDYSQNLSQSIAQALAEISEEDNPEEKEPHRLLLKQINQESEASYATQVQDLKALDLEVLYFTGFYSEAQLFLQEAVSQDLQVPIVMGQGSFGCDSSQLGGGAVEGAILYCGLNPQEPTPEMQAFLDTYGAKYPAQHPNFLEIQGYDALKTIAAAIHKANSTDPKVFKAVLNQTAQFPGVSGLTVFGGAGKPAEPAEEGGTLFPYFLGLYWMEDQEWILRREIPVSGSSLSIESDEKRNAESSSGYSESSK